MRNILRSAPSFLALLALVVIPLAAGVTAASEESGANGKPVLSVLLVGDSLSIGLAKQLEPLLAERGEIGFTHLGKVSSGLARPAFFDWEANLRAMVSAKNPDLTIIMLGANDNKSLTMDDGRVVHFDMPEWDAAYAVKVRSLADIATAGNPSATVMFLGVPIMRDETLARDVARVNEVLKKVCQASSRFVYVDTWPALADPSGRYADRADSAAGPAVLRVDDGVHVAPAGSRLLALAVIEALAVRFPVDLTAARTVLARDDIRPVAQAALPTMRAERTDSREQRATLAGAEKNAAVAASLGLDPAQITTRVVAEGETLWRIARSSGVDMASLKKVNPALDPDRLRAGQTIFLPARPEKPGPGAVEVVERVEVAADIALAPEKAATLDVAPTAVVADVAAPATFVADVATSPAPATFVADVATSPALATEAPAADVPAPVRAEAASPEQARTYVLASGDNFWSVAKRLGLAPSELARANPNLDSRRLRPGMTLAVPAGARPVRTEVAAAVATAPAVASVPEGGSTHAVAEGDNFWSLARRHGLTVAALEQANPGLDSRRLKLGSRLVIPARGESNESVTVKAESVPTPDRYAVAEGDTIWGVAQRLGVNFVELKKVNADLDPKKLQPGDLLRLPRGAEAAAAGPKAPAAEHSALARPDMTAYPVAKGDTLWTISRRYGLSVAQLRALNADIDPQRLQIGQRLSVPAEAQVRAVGRENVEMRAVPVQKGDTLSAIAARFGLALDVVLLANAGVDPSRLREGQLVYLPADPASVLAVESAGREMSAASDDETRLYAVAKGDTLWDLSRRFGVSVDQLRELNAGTAPERLMVGQMLRLPVSVVTMAGE